MIRGTDGDRGGPEAKQADPFAVEMGLEDLDLSVDVASMEMLGSGTRSPSDCFPTRTPTMSRRPWTSGDSPSLRQQKSANAATVLACLERKGDKVTITRDEALAWLTALNDLRPSLAVRLGLEDEASHEELVGLPTGGSALRRLPDLRLLDVAAGFPVRALSD